MLVLSRKAGETIRMILPASATPQVVDVIVNEIRGDKARIACHADPSVRIHRLEIIESIAAGEHSKPAKPHVLPVVKIGDKLPGEL
jgi:carbon storage regulator CsrA